MGTPVTLESVTYLRNATVTSVGDRDSVQSGNRSAYGIIAAAGKINRSSHPWGLEQLLLGAGRLQNPLSSVLGARWV